MVIEENSTEVHGTVRDGGVILAEGQSNLTGAVLNEMN